MGTPRYTPRSAVNGIPLELLNSAASCLLTLGETKSLDFCGLITRFEQLENSSIHSFKIDTTTCLATKARFARICVEVDLDGLGLAPGWLAYIPYDFRTFFFDTNLCPFFGIVSLRPRPLLRIAHLDLNPSSHPYSRHTGLYRGWQELLAQQD